MDWRISVIVPLLVASAFAGAGDKYTRVGHTVDTRKCPPRLALEQGFVPNPAFTVSPQQVLLISNVRCGGKILVTVFADSENYYVTARGAEPGSTYTRVVNGRNGKTSIIGGK
jgi:hypothetical protein